MMMIETDRIYAVYARKNKRVRWCYADYCGRWTSVDEAIKKVKTMYYNRVEYMVVNMATDETVKGFTKKKD